LDDEKDDQSESCINPMQVLDNPMQVLSTESVVEETIFIDDIQLD
jgi:hypothetical protein